jgi:hypothetical protein
MALSHDTVVARLMGFKLLESGWLDGYGARFNHADLDWLAHMFLENFPRKCPVPNTYPTEDGGVMFEWPDVPQYPSLEINISQKSAEWFSENDEKMDLSIPSGWARVAELLSDHDMMAEVQGDEE